MRTWPAALALLAVAHTFNPAWAEIANHRAIYELDTNGESSEDLEMTGTLEMSLARGCGYIRQELIMATSTALAGKRDSATHISLKMVVQESSDHRRGSSHFWAELETPAGAPSIFSDPISFDFTYERMEDGLLMVERFKDGDPYPSRQRADVLTPMEAYLQELGQVDNGPGEWAIRYLNPINMRSVTRRFSPPQPQPLPRGVEDPANILAGQKHWEYTVEEEIEGYGSVPARYGLSENGVLTLMSFGGLGIGALNFRLTRVETAQFPGCD